MAPSRELNVGYILCHGNVTNFDTMIRHFTTSIKSILIFTEKKINFRIVTDDLEGINEMIFENIPEKYWPDFDVRGDNTKKDMLKYHRMSGPMKYHNNVFS